MSTNIGTISGLIELKDEFSGQLDLASVALGKFTKENQESLKAVAGAAGLVTAAFAAVAASTVALGNRGADVNDLRGTIEQFAGSAKAADESMAGLRRGTLNTVDDFTLAKQAAHLLSAGVKLTADDFETLGGAAFVLQNRGLGPTNEQLKLVSDALVTGRTRALAMAVGVVEAKDAEQSYADSLGVSKEMLSERGKVEAHRIEVMRILKTAVKEAGDQERDFGEQLEAASAFVTNMIDKLASSIASSKVFAAGFEAVGKAVTAAFGTDQEQQIAQITATIERGAIFTVNFGLAAVEMARVVNVAWSAVKTVVLGAETIILGTAEAIASILVEISRAGEAVKILPEGTTAQLEDTRVVLQAMTEDLAAQTAEAAKGVIGQSEFDRTLDELGGTLFTIKDAMSAASLATAENSAATTVAEENARKLAATEKELSEAVNQRMIDQSKMADLIEKTQAEIDTIYKEHIALRLEMSGTSYDVEKARIEADFQAQVAKLDKLNPLYKQHYDALRTSADLALQSLGNNWDQVRDKSLEALRQQAQAARETYNMMQTSGLTFTREVLEDQRKKVEALEAAARGMGEGYTEAFEKAAIAAKAVADETERLRKEAEKAKAANLAMGGSFEITRANFEASARGLGADVGLVEALLKKGYSFQQAILWSKHPDWPPPENPGPRVPGFARGGFVARGGLAVVGEEGPEAVRLPLGSTVFPTEMTSAMMNEARGAGPAGSLVLNFHVNGTAEETARKIKKTIMEELKRYRQFGAS